jgi:hypothetical protein
MKRVAALVVGITIAKASSEFAVPAASAGENTATTPTGRRAAVGSRPMRCRAGTVATR